MASLTFLAVGISYAPAAISGSVTPNNGIAYVTNGGQKDGNGSVSLIDIGTLQVVGSVPLAGSPTGLALRPNGRFLYVTGLLSNAVTAFDTKTLGVVADVQVCTAPVNVVITPNGQFAYVSCLGGAVSVIETRTNTVVATVVIPAGSGSIAFSNNGKLAYSTDFSAKNISVIDTRINQVVNNIPLADFNSTGIALTPNGKALFVEELSEVAKIDTKTNNLLADIAPGGCGPMIVITPNGKLAYVSDFCNNRLLVIDTNQAKLVTTVPMSTPIGSAVTRNGAFTFAVNNECPAFPCDRLGTVSVVDTTANQVVATITVGVNPLNVVLAPGS